MRHRRTNKAQKKTQKKRRPSIYEISQPYTTESTQKPPVTWCFPPGCPESRVHNVHPGTPVHQVKGNRGPLALNAVNGTPMKTMAGGKVSHKVRQKSKKFHPVHQAVSPLELPPVARVSAFGLRKSRKSRAITPERVPLVYTSQTPVTTMNVNETLRLQVVDSESPAQTIHNARPVPRFSVPNQRTSDIYPHDQLQDIIHKGTTTESPITTMNVNETHQLQFHLADNESQAQTMMSTPRPVQSFSVPVQHTSVIYPQDQLQEIIHKDTTSESTITTMNVNETHQLRLQLAANESPAQTMMSTPRPVQSFSVPVQHTSGIYPHDQLQEIMHKDTTMGSPITTINVNETHQLRLQLADNETPAQAIHNVRPVQRISVPVQHASVIYPHDQLQEIIATNAEKERIRSNVYPLGPHEVHIEAPLLKPNSMRIEAPLLEPNSMRIEAPLLEPNSMRIEAHFLEPNQIQIEAPLLEPHPIHIEAPRLVSNEIRMQSSFINAAPREFRPIDDSLTGNQPKPQHNPFVGSSHGGHQPTERSDPEANALSSTVRSDAAVACMQDLLKDILRAGGRPEPTPRPPSPPAPRPDPQPPSEGRRYRLPRQHMYESQGPQDLRPTSHGLPRQPYPPVLQPAGSLPAVHLLGAQSVPMDVRRPGQPFLQGEPLVYSSQPDLLGPEVPPDHPLPVLSYVGYPQATIRYQSQSDLQRGPYARYDPELVPARRYGDRYSSLGPRSHRLRAPRYSCRRPMHTVYGPRRPTIPAFCRR